MPSNVLRMSLRIKSLLLLTTLLHIVAATNELFTFRYPPEPNSATSSHSQPSLFRVPPRQEGEGFRGSQRPNSLQLVAVPQAQQEGSPHFGTQRDRSLPRPRSPVRSQSPDRLRSRPRGTSALNFAMLRQLLANEHDRQRTEGRANADFRHFSREDFPDLSSRGSSLIKPASNAGSKSRVLTETTNIGRSVLNTPQDTPGQTPRSRRHSAQGKENLLTDPPPTKAKGVRTADEDDRDSRHRGS